MLAPIIGRLCAKKAEKMPLTLTQQELTAGTAVDIDFVSGKPLWDLSPDIFPHAGG
jgi:hypothetical protein